VVPQAPLAAAGWAPDQDKPTALSPPAPTTAANADADQLYPRRFPNPNSSLASTCPSAGLDGPGGTRERRPPPPQRHGSSPPKPRTPSPDPQRRTKLNCNIRPKSNRWSGEFAAQTWRVGLYVRTGWETSAPGSRTTGRPTVAARTGLPIRRAPVPGFQGRREQARRGRSQQPVAAHRRRRRRRASRPMHTAAPTNDQPKEARTEIAYAARLCQFNSHSGPRLGRVNLA
jgi:hypothetical protein